MVRRRSFLKLAAILPVAYSLKVFSEKNHDDFVKPLVVDNVNSAKELALKSGMFVKTRGYHHPGDGGGMLYLVKNQSPNDDNHYINIGNGYYLSPIINDFISFKQLGLIMDGHHDNTEQLREILSKKGKYFFNPGTLIVKDYIELNSNISIIGSGMESSIIEYRNSKNNWLFINGEKSNPHFLKGSGYNGRGDYIFSKFSINLRGDIAEESRSAMIFGRAKNVIIDQVHFYNGKNSHRIECNSQLNFIAKNCIFSDTTITQNGSHEEINVDFDNKEGFPAYGEWDNTPCKNIQFISCHFSNVQKGIASHSTPPVHHSNIIVKGCTFSNIKIHAIQFQGVDNSIIQNCDFLNCNDSDIALINANNNKIIRNKTNNLKEMVSYNSNCNNNIAY